MARHPEGITPKLIAYNTSINVNTVKSILPKLKGIRKTVRGFYKVVEGGDAPLSLTPDALTDWTFHNCIMSTITSYTKPNNISSTYSFGLINLEFTISKTGNATLRVATDTPLNVSSICLVYAYFLMLLKEHSQQIFLMNEVYIKTIEFNRDYSNLRLDGVNCITVDSLIEQFKIYQKRRGLRIEHKTKIPLTVENVVDMLTNNPNSLESNIKLAAQAKQLDRLTTATAANTQILYKIIDNMKGGN